MGIAGVHRHIDAPTSYLPAVRREVSFGPSADRDVQRWRRMGASWQTVAANLGCSVHLARKTWDPGYAPVHAPAEPIVAPKPATGPAPGRIHRGTYQHDTLIALKDGPLDRAELGGRLAIRVQDFSRMIDGMAAKRLVALPRTGLFQITAAGLAELRRLEGLAPSPAIKPAPPTGRPLGADKRRERYDSVLLALAADQRPSSAIADIAGLSCELTGNALRSLKDLGLVGGKASGHGRGYLWFLTVEGRERVAALQGRGHG